jgi:hypothetical protein
MYLVLEYCPRCEVYRLIYVQHPCLALGMHLAPAANSPSCLTGLSN